MAKKIIIDPKTAKQIIDFYLIPKSGYQTSLKFGISEHNLYKLLAEHDISKHSPDIVKQLRTRTNIELYGDANPMKNKTVVNKAQQTCIIRYGVSNPSKLDTIKKKKKETCLKNYGVEVAMQSDTIKRKYHKTCMQKYGRPNTGMIVKEKRDKTMLERYGVTSASQVQEFKEKAKQTTIEHYGVDNPGKSLIIRERVIQTCQKHFGVDFPQQDYAVHRKCRKAAMSSLGRGRYHYNNETLDSKPELAFYIYHTDIGTNILHEPGRIQYTFNGKVHYYFPDFLVNNRYVEIKGEHLYKKMQIENTIDNAKFKCMLQNKVEILTESQYLFYINYCEQKYGKNFYKNYKN